MRGCSAHRGPQRQEASLPCPSRNTTAPFPAQQLESIPVIRPTMDAFPLKKSRGSARKRRCLLHRQPVLPPSLQVPRCHDARCTAASFGCAPNSYLPPPASSSHLHPICTCGNSVLSPQLGMETSQPSPRSQSCLRRTGTALGFIFPYQVNQFLEGQINK